MRTELQVDKFCPLVFDYGHYWSWTRFGIDWGLSKDILDRETIFGYSLLEGKTKLCTQCWAAFMFIASFKIITWKFSLFIKRLYKNHSEHFILFGHVWSVLECRFALHVISRYHRFNSIGHLQISTHFLEAEFYNLTSRLDNNATLFSSHLSANVEAESVRMCSMGSFTSDIGILLHQRIERGN